MDYEKEIPFGAFDSELMHQEINIPDGFEATIEGNKIILAKTESEDERIRKEIIYHIKNCDDTIDGETEKRMLAWLEKQGKGKLTDKPKFKVGDWIVNNDDSSVGQITQIIDGEDGFAYEQTNGYFHGIFEKEYHLWTIQDAKDGDFLACPLPRGKGEQVFIFKEIGKREYIDNCIEFYCRVCQDVFFDNTGGGFMGTTSDEFKPATQEQRTLLIQRMHESGYKWDSDKKELKVIKQKPVELSEDEEIDEEYKIGKWFTGLIPCWINAPSTLQAEHSNHGKNVVAIHLKGGGYRCCCVDDKKPTVFNVAENTPFEEGWHNRESSAWSKEDEEHIHSLLDRLEGMCKKGATFTATRFAVNQDMDWLKSLKQRIGE